MSNPPNRGKGAAIRWIRDHAGYQGDDCLMWPFRGPNGYGVFGYLGKQYYAHRYMCELVKGPPPTPEHEAAHSCGRGQFGCVNPCHLSWKTPSDNQRDRRLHGTKSSGGRGRLTDEQAAQIRALRGAMPQREIAAMFNTSRANVSLIMTGNLHAENKVRPGKGYSYVKATGKYTARIGIQGGSVFLGHFDTEDEARAIYLLANARARAGLPVSREILRGQGASPHKETGGTNHAGS